MLYLRDVVQAPDLDTALDALTAAIANYDRACIEGDRPDAIAFRAACAAVLAFAVGDSQPADAVNTVDSAAADWLRGYLGEDPHWRTSRSDVAPQWAALIRDLNSVADLDETAWYDTAALLADVGRIYVAYNSTTLLANAAATAVFRKSEMAAVPVATPAILGPRLDAGLAASADKLRLVDRWLTAQSEMSDSSTVVTAISKARERLRSPTPASGKECASYDVFPQDVCEALNEHLSAAEIKTLGAVSDVSVVTGRPLEILHRVVRNRLLTELRNINIDAYRIWEGQLSGIVESLVRLTAHTIDQQQGGARNLPWHNAAEGKKAAEHYLADYAYLWFKANGYDATVEGANIGGGRADVVIRVGVERFVIEVKQINRSRSSEDLTADYGPQAQQYTMTAAPFAFLAVLDNVPRISRIDLNSSMWTGSWTNVETNVTNALAAARVLADAKPPSAQPSTRKQASRRPLHGQEGRAEEDHSDDGR